MYAKLKYVLCISNVFTHIQNYFSVDYYILYIRKRIYSVDELNTKAIQAFQLDSISEWKNEIL